MSKSIVWKIEPDQIETLRKFGLLWDNYEGLTPKLPYQPEFVTLDIRKYENKTVLYGEADIVSNTDVYPDKQNSSVLTRAKKWYKCNNDEMNDFELDTIDDASENCRKMISTIKTFYSKVSPIDQSCLIQLIWLLRWIL